MTFFRPQTLQSKLSLRFSSSSFVTKKWPLSHPNRRRLQRLRYHLQRDELLIRPPSPSLAPTKKPGHVPEPTPQDLKIVAFHASIPFVGQLLIVKFVPSCHGHVQFISDRSNIMFNHYLSNKGFGIMDNGILILAGMIYSVALSLTAFRVIVHLDLITLYSNQAKQQIKRLAWHQE